MPITKKVQIINWKKFAAVALALNKEAFIIYVTYLEAKILIHTAPKAQIAWLLAKKINIPKEYTDFSDVFSKKSIIILLNCSNINKHIINLKPSKQLPYRPIYNLSIVKLETFKTYIEINLTNKFIWPFKSSVKIPIFLIQKLDKSLYLYINYHNLNNLTIINWYLLLLISKLLDKLWKTKGFI